MASSRNFEEISREDAKHFPLRVRVVAFFLLPLLLYGIALPFFDFWSDDFGYFLNFDGQSRNLQGLVGAFGSYLTGGVPRLQLGWHVTHQLLYLVIGKSVWAYFLVQMLVVSANSFLLEKVLRQVTGPVVSFWSALFLAFSPFFQESFYWISANYGFFQLFFLLLSYLLFEKSFSVKKVLRLALVFLASCSLVISCLYMEQSVPFFAAWPVVFIFFNWQRFAKRSLIGWSLGYLVLASVLFVALYAPQMLLINDKSSTSLGDSIAMYYPTPWASTLNNAGKIARQGIAGIIPTATDFEFLWTHRSEIKSRYVFLFFSVMIACAAIIFWISLSERKNRVSGIRLFSPLSFLGMMGWLVAATIVVLPITSFCSRYIYLIQSAGIPLTVAILVCASGRLHKVLLPILAFVCFSSTAAFYYGSYFPLTDVQHAAAPQLLETLSKNQNLKAVVFKNFPKTLGNAVNGAWINYHAADWWIKWNLLPTKSPVQMLGLDATPVLASPEHASGFRLTYGPYPADRMKTIYKPEETLFVEYLSSPLDSEQRFSFRVPQSVDKVLNEQQRVLTPAASSFDLALPAEMNDLRNCFVDVIADVTSRGDSKFAGAVHLYKSDGTYLGYASGFSSGESGVTEKAFFRTIVEQKGPYFVRLNLQPPPVAVANPKDPPQVEIGKVQIFACGKEYQASTFVGMHNPDPKNPYLRYVSPQKNYSVTLAYDGAEVWERFYTTGVNDSMNRGDYYCFPDDTFLLQEGASQNPLRTYLGMLNWKREVKIDGDKLTIQFRRSPGDGRVARQRMDVMPLDEWNNYERDDPPVDLKVTHLFELNKNYYTVQVNVVSRSTELLRFMYGFEDSSVFDFQVGSDLGVQTMILSSGQLNQSFASGRPREMKDVGITFRQMWPKRYNMAVFEYSVSPFYAGHNLAFDSPRNLEFLNRSEEIKYGKPISPNTLMPTRTHGIWHVASIAPGESKTIEYKKVMLSDWYDLDDLKKQALSTITDIEAEKSPGH